MNSRQFSDAFRELWYRDQDELERAKLWYPDKRPHQVYDEFEWYLYLVSCIDNPIVVEIGAGQGRQAKFYRELLGTRQYITVDVNPDAAPTVLGDSGRPETRGEVERLLTGPVDVLFIDGDHGREGVEKDWDLWFPLVRDSGFVAFHDTHHGHGSHCDGAVVMWEALKQRYESWDIHTRIDEEYPAVPMNRARTKWKQAGIGLLRIGGAQQRPGDVLTSQEFERRFWDLWYANQSPIERAKMWYPAKRPRQVASEFMRYLYIVSSIRSPVCVEIGVATGLERPFYERLLGSRQYLTVDIDPNTDPDVVGDSTAPETLQKVKDRLIGPVDVLFIDGSHDRQIAPKDWHLWTPLVREGGYVGLDDSHHDHSGYCDGSARVWHRVKDRHAQKWDLFDECTDEHPALPKTKNRARYKQAGIGVLRV